MFYRLYKLRFITPVRFGADSRGAGLDQASMAGHADTLFSALCCEAAAYSKQIMMLLIDAAQAGSLLLSDLFPYRGETLYLPRPLLPPRNPSNRPDRTPEDIRRESARRKHLKQQNYLAVGQFSAYMNWLEQGGDFDIEQPDFGTFISTSRVNRRSSEALPYLVTGYRFQEEKDNAGLYFIVAAANNELFPLIDNLIDSLGHSGIGGKRSSGYGKFELAEDPIDMDEHGVYEDDALLYAMLTAGSSEWYMALSVLWPMESELSLLQEAYYLTVQRSGFVNDPSYAPQSVKRHGIYMLNAGSCFKQKAAGQIGDLTAGGTHPIYRYGKPIYAGVMR